MTFCKLSHGYAYNNDLGGGVFQAGGHAKKCRVKVTKMMIPVGLRCG